MFALCLALWKLAISYAECNLPHHSAIEFLKTNIQIYIWKSQPKKKKIYTWKFLCKQLVLRMCINHMRLLEQLLWDLLVASFMQTCVCVAFPPLFMNNLVWRNLYSPSICHLEKLLLCLLCMDSSYRGIANSSLCWNWIQRSLNFFQCTPLGLGY